MKRDKYYTSWTKLFTDSLSGVAPLPLHLISTTKKGNSNDEMIPLFTFQKFYEVTGELQPPTGHNLP